MNTRVLKILLALSIIISGCSESSQQSQKQQSHYPGIVDSLQVNNWYDSTKWYLYTYYCMDTPKLILDNEKETNLVNLPYGSLELKFDSLQVINDSFYLFFDFYNHTENKLLVPGNYPDIHVISNGLMFRKATVDSVLCIANSNSSYRLKCTFFSKEILDTTSFKLIKPLQPDVIHFIRTNSKSLNPWFLEQAKKRGVLN
ncbi:hypothetical protein [Edaphocola flava]|uniref:hypothetical protein n=1 Tax=Edaphocola flava TaxID=2499629 RepID=UPI00100A2B79|nr:hypothetical protein [Edaphocola flava]